MGRSEVVRGGLGSRGGKAMSAAAQGLKMQVSPDNWKGASAHTMKLSQAIIARSDREMRNSRRTDPLPLLRDACIRESNDRIHAYVRATRAVIMQLRKKLVATNEEIKALTRGKESLERALEHTRKDLALNHQSMEIRDLRPVREKVYTYVRVHKFKGVGLATAASHYKLITSFCILTDFPSSLSTLTHITQEPDAADICLLGERAHLFSIKRSLEAQLSKTQQQLQILSVARAHLAAVLQERSRVTDLLCHSMSSTVAVSHFTSSQIISHNSKKVIMQCIKLYIHMYMWVPRGLWLIYVYK